MTSLGKKQTLWQPQASWEDNSWNCEYSPYILLWNACSSWQKIKKL